MLRPPPTSISISAQDVAFHSQHIEIYHGLMKQGFKKEEIWRYIREQRMATKNPDPFISSTKVPKGLSWVELACQEREEHCNQSSEVQRSGVGKEVRTASEDHEGNTMASNENNTINSDALYQISELHRQANSRRQTSTSELPHNSDDTSVSPPIQPVQIPRNGMARRHAPRQSSLLRFSSNLPSDEAKALHRMPIASSTGQSSMTYRPRTESYSYEQSGTEYEQPEDSILADVFQDLLLDDNLVLERTLRKSNHREEPQNSSDNPISGSSGNPTSESDFSDAQDEHSTPDVLSDSTVLIAQRLQFHKIGSQPSVIDFGSSPPLAMSNEEGRFSPESSSPSLPLVQPTPRLVDQELQVDAEVRQISPQYLDGQSFTPYNDSMPAELQPQTPADLSRHGLVNETNATYTALPGTLRSGTTSIHREHRDVFEPGQESPTNRAISMRRRRNVEYSRSARIEALRVTRLIRHLRTGQDGEETGSRSPADIWDIREQSNLWRDDLDADRVGEENFDDDELRVNNTTIGVRIVSGNRRAHGL